MLIKNAFLMRCLCVCDSKRHFLFFSSMTFIFEKLKLRQIDSFGDRWWWTSIDGLCTSAGNWCQFPFCLHLNKTLGRPSNILIDKKLQSFRALIKLNSIFVFNLIFLLANDRFVTIATESLFLSHTHTHVDTTRCSLLYANEFNLTGNILAIKCWKRPKWTQRKTKRMFIFIK